MTDNLSFFKARAIVADIVIDTAVAPKLCSSFIFEWSQIVQTSVPLSNLKTKLIKALSEFSRNAAVYVEKKFSDGVLRTEAEATQLVSAFMRRWPNIRFSPAKSKHPASPRGKLQFIREVAMPSFPAKLATFFPNNWLEYAVNRILADNKRDRKMFNDFHLTHLCPTQYTLDETFSNLSPFAAFAALMNLADFDPNFLVCLINAQSDLASFIDIISPLVGSDPVWEIKDFFPRYAYGKYYVAKNEAGYLILPVIIAHVPRFFLRGHRSDVPISASGCSLINPSDEGLLVEIWLGDRILDKTIKEDGWADRLLTQHAREIEAAYQGGRTSFGITLDNLASFVPGADTFNTSTAIVRYSGVILLGFSFPKMYYCSQSKAVAEFEGQVLNAQFVFAPDASFPPQGTLPPAGSVTSARIISTGIPHTFTPRESPLQTPSVPAIVATFSPGAPPLAVIPRYTKSALSRRSIHYHFGTLPAGLRGKTIYLLYLLSVSSVGTPCLLQKRPRRCWMSWRRVSTGVTQCQHRNCWTRSSWTYSSLALPGPQETRRDRGHLLTSGSRAAATGLRRLSLGTPILDLFFCNFWYCKRRVNVGNLVTTTLTWNDQRRFARFL